MKYRFERKWVYKNTHIDKLVADLTLSKLNFYEQFNKRFVNTIYFDDLKLNSAQDNIDGINFRSKHRVRWYGGELELLKKPILEKKVKKNFLGYKKYYELKKFDNLELNNQNLFELTKKINSLIQRKLLYPVSLVSYKRMYFVSFDEKIRATLDYKIKYKNLMNYENSFFSSSDDIILEAKYPKECDNYFRMNYTHKNRFSRNSKYINSILKRSF